MVVFFFTSIIFEGGGTTIQSCLGHPFGQQRPWTDAENTASHVCLSLCIRRNYSTLSHRDTEHADVLATCADWLLKHLFLLCDGMLD